VLAAILGGIVFLFVLGYHHRMARLPVLYADGNAAVARMLHDYSGKGYTMAVSESGLLPFYSGWRAIDTWGLNDIEIAHGRARRTANLANQTNHDPDSRYSEDSRFSGITEERLARESPHLIAFHAYFAEPLVKPAVRNEWDAMVMKLKAYAEKRGYALAAIFGETPYDTQHYYVRADFPDRAQIVERIRSTPYTQMSTGRACINYALVRGGP